MRNLDLFRISDLSRLGKTVAAVGHGGRVVWNFGGPPDVSPWAAAAGYSGAFDVLEYTDGAGVWRAYRLRGSGFLTLSRPGLVEFLIVAGGGAGAQQPGGAGGGGAGGYLEGVAEISAGETPVLVGAGGGGFYPGTTDGFRGEDSSFAGLTAMGGGGGLASTSSSIDTAVGGSGGGLRWGNIGLTAGTEGQGFRGSGGFSGSRRAGGSGGGAGGEGIAPTETTAGQGGPGRLSTITGEPVFYAGGGGGSANAGLAGLGGIGGGADGRTGNGVGFSAVPHTGGGGGGSRNTTGGGGGSGVVVVRFRLGG